MITCVKTGIILPQFVLSPIQSIACPIFSGITSVSITEKSAKSIDNTTKSEYGLILSRSFENVDLFLILPPPQTVYNIFPCILVNFQEVHLRCLFPQSLHLQAQ